tara:strand:- start:479 stop:1447 length:969 start_codon:yes stop_codon:yes gene_type:complete
MNLDFKNYLLKITNSSACEEIEIIQSLWSGYGKVSRYQLFDSQLNTIVVKCISLNKHSEHPRGWNTNKSHNRKVKSYQIETHWYEKWNQLCTNNCKTPKFIGSFSEGKDQWIIMEDLNENFPLRKEQLDFSEIKVCLKWLANFHATFLNKKPTGLWEIGTYWHLKTRSDEFEKMEHPELKAKAPLIDQLLNECQHQTIVHGDAKLANFCFTEDGRQVAAVDFQYVGSGCGMKDVAYFLGSCLPSVECTVYENELLNYYFSALQKALGPDTSSINFKALALEWRQLYPIACTDFTRFLLGWMPSHQKVNQYNINLMNLVLEGL